MPGPGAAVLVLNAAEMIPRFPLMRSSGTGNPDPDTFFVDRIVGRGKINIPRPRRDAADEPRHTAAEMHVSSRVEPPPRYKKLPPMMRLPSITLVVRMVLVMTNVVFVTSTPKFVTTRVVFVTRLNVVITLVVHGSSASAFT